MSDNDTISDALLDELCPVLDDAKLDPEPEPEIDYWALYTEEYD